MPANSGGDEISTGGNLFWQLFCVSFFVFILVFPGFLSVLLNGPSFFFCSWQRCFVYFYGRLNGIYLSICSCFTCLLIICLGKKKKKEKNYFVAWLNAFFFFYASCFFILCTLWLLIWTLWGFINSMGLSEKPSDALGGKPQWIIDLEKKLNTKHKKKRKYRDMWVGFEEKNWNGQQHLTQ